MQILKCSNGLLKMKTIDAKMWDLIVSVPDHCLSFYFQLTKEPVFIVLKSVEREEHVLLVCSL